MSLQVIGLTGGIGMGKTTSAKLLAQRGLPVIDTDQIARDVVEPGQPAWEAVVAAFGPTVVGPDQRLRREVLAQRVFSDPTQRRRLEEILHPRIREGWGRQVDLWRSEGRPRGVVVIPLLYETAAADLFARVVCVGCSAASQRTRLAERGWDPEQSEQRIAAQWPIERKIALAHFVIWTEGDLEVHAHQLDRMLQALG